MTSCWTPSLVHYSSYSSHQLLPVVCRMATMIVNAKTSKFQTVHTKYTSKKYLQVSQLEEFKSETVRKLAAKDLEGI